MKPWPIDPETPDLREIEPEPTPHFGFNMPELELEFKVIDFELSGASKTRDERNRNLEALLSDGWEITDKIVCRPQVMIFFSRVKEIKENV